MEADVRQHMVLAGLGGAMGEASTWQAAAGAVLGGELDVGSETYSLSPGLVLQGRLGRRFVEPAGGRPWIDGSISAAMALASLGDDDWIATDVRLGASAGWMLGESLGLYGAGRLFGGPILWTRGDETLGGSDPDHYQLAAGAVLALPAGLGAFVEVAPLGERAAAAGLSLAL